MSKRKLLVLSAALAALSPWLSAQEAAGVPPNPISASEKGFYALVSGEVVAAAEKMPEANYAFKPTPDVRSFGQLVGHVADAQYGFCSTAGGEQVAPKGIEKSKSSKADLVAALKEAVAFCSKTYAGMTDARGSEIVKLMGFNLARLTALSVNTAHTDEHYGNMVTYMRLKGLVPPSSEPPANQGPK